MAGRAVPVFKGRMDRFPHQTRLAGLVRLMAADTIQIHHIAVKMSCFESLIVTIMAFKAKPGDSRPQE